MIEVEIVQMHLFFLKVINNTAVIKVFSDEASFFNEDVDIVDDVERINNFSCWQRTKPVPRMDFIGTEFPVQDAVPRHLSSRRPV